MSSSSELTRQCLNFEERASTPPHVRKFRRSAHLEPGKRFQHPGVVDDYPKLKLEDKIFGMSDQATREGAADLIHVGKTTEFERLSQVKAERIYKSTAREPLGRTAERNMALPTKFTERGEAFGVKTVSANLVAKDLIFPHDSFDDGTGHDLYIKSHGSYGPGEQRRRDYQWNVDPESTRFGRKGDTIALNGVSANITEVLKGTPESNNMPVVNMKKVEDFRNMADQLGKTKNLGQDSGSRPRDMVYGKPSGVKTLTAAEVIRGRYTPADAQPDRDLGKSIRPGFRNVTYQDRSYGCPSIRNDIPALPYNRRSLADCQNYGDDVPAQQLINPPALSDYTFGPLALNEQRSKETIEHLFQRIGYSLDHNLFDMIWEQVSQGAESCSINAFRNVLNDYIIQNDLMKN